MVLDDSTPLALKIILLKWKYCIRPLIPLLTVYYPISKSALSKEKLCQFQKF